MECDASVSQSMTNFIFNQSYLVQTAIVLGFVLVVFFAITFFWISSLVGGDFSQWFSDKVQEWTGALSLLAIISILCTVAVEMNYWTTYQIPNCELSGAISVTKSVSMLVIFTLQMIWIRAFLVECIYPDDWNVNWKGQNKLESATTMAFWKCYAFSPIYMNSFPRYFSPNNTVPKAGEREFRNYGVWMFVGAIYSILTASIQWLKFMTVNLGLTDLKLDLDFLGVEVEYTFILEKLTYLHTIWLGFPFVNFVVDSLISIAALSWFMWRFRLFPKIPWIIRKFILKKP